MHADVYILHTWPQCKALALSGQLSEPIQETAIGKDERMGTSVSLLYNFSIG
jgi:hypothetical protein